MKSFTFSIRASLAFLLAVTAVSSARAQGITASAVLSGFQSGGTYDYTVTFDNSASSTDAIQTIWLAWIPSPYDLLPSQPSNVQTPTGWTGYVIGGGGSPYDGYSIEFTTTGSGHSVNPGGSIQFQFTSPDSPTTLNGSSPYPFPGYYATLISYAYENAASGANVEPSGDNTGFLATAVTAAPEPSTVGLLALGAGLLLAARRKFRPAPAKAD